MKKEFFILGAFIIALCLYLVFHSEEKINYKLPVLSRVPVEDITTVAIEKNGTSINLYRKNDLWTVSDQHYPADTGIVKKLLDVIETLRVSALVSESRDLTRYDLTSEKSVKVTVKKGDDILRSFEVGKAAPTRNHTFVKLAGQDGVFHAPGNFRQDFDRDVEGFRSKKIFGFDRDALTSLKVEKGGINRMIFAQKQGDKEPEIKKSGNKESDVKEPEDKDKESAWKAQDGNGVDTDKINSLVADLTNLECASYQKEETGAKDETAKNGKDKDTLLKITISTGSGDGAKTSYLVLGEKMKDGEYKAFSSQTVYPFILNAYQGDDFTAMVDAILGIKEKAKGQVQEEKQSLDQEQGLEQDKK